MNFILSQGEREGNGPPGPGIRDKRNHLPRQTTCARAAEAKEAGNWWGRGRKKEVRMLAVRDKA